MNRLNKANADTIWKSINPHVLNLDGLGLDCGIYDQNAQFVYPPVLGLSRQAVESAKWLMIDDGFTIRLYIKEYSNKL